MDRVPTGIKGFDELIEGGIPKGFTVLYCGSPGTGKTIFALQYLYNGAKMFNEKSIYITFEQKRQDLIDQAKQFGWDLEELEKNNLLKLYTVSIKELGVETAGLIANFVRDGGYKRLVIDSLSTLTTYAPIYTAKDEQCIKDYLGNNVFFSPPIIGDNLVKKYIYTFLDDLRQLTDVTTIVVGEAPIRGDYISRDTISEFVCDGIISVTFESLGGGYSRSMIVRKMRNTKNDQDLHPLEIGKEGIVVHKLE
jgi:KaiC/GvpD/RAD55 family RecA-like ATPase